MVQMCPPAFYPIGQKGVPQPVPGAIARYDFDDGSGQVLTDYSGNGNHGTLGSTAGVDTNDPAWNAQGLVFGGDDFVNCGNSSNLWAPQMTIFVAFTQKFAGNSPLILKSPTTGNNRDFSIILDSIGRIHGWFGYDVPNHVDQTHSKTYPLGIPRIAVLRIGAGVATIYDGYTFESTAFSFQPVNGGYDLVFGRAGSTSSLYLTGDLYSGVLYPYALLDTQITQETAFLKYDLALKGVILP